LEAPESELEESAAELDAVPEAELSSEVDEAEELLSLSLSLSLSLLSLSEELVEEELDEPLVSEASESDDEVVRVVAEARPPVVPSTTEASVCTPLPPMTEVVDEPTLTRKDDSLP